MCNIVLRRYEVVLRNIDNTFHKKQSRHFTKRGAESRKVVANATLSRVDKARTSDKVTRDTFTYCEVFDRKHAVTI